VTSARRRRKILHLYASVDLHRSAPVLTKLNHYHAMYRELRRKCIQSHRQTLAMVRSTTIATIVNHGRKTWGNPNSGARKRIATCPFLNGQSKSQPGQLVNSKQGLVNHGQFAYFTSYLAGGSSVRTLNGQKRKESSYGSSSPARQLWKFPEILKYNGIKSQA